VDNIFSAAIVIAYISLLTFVAIRARADREFEDFSLARRSLPVAMVFASLAATYIGPGFSIGFVGRGFKSGFLFLGIGLAYALQNILVGLLLAPRLRGLSGCHTLGEAIGLKYDKRCHVLAGAISVGLCAGFASVMAKAGGEVVHDIFGLPPALSVVVVVALTALFPTIGGLRANVAADSFQFITFSLLLPLMLLLVLGFHLEGGPAAFASQASAATINGFKSTSALEIAGLVAAFLLGETLIPPYANRALACRTTDVSRNSFILAGLFSLFWFMVMISLGITARSIIPIDTREDVVLLNLIKTVLPSFGRALLFMALVSVVMSSLDSLLNAGAVAFTQDVVKPFVKLSDNLALRTGRAATIIIALVAAAGAVAVPSIIGGLLICYTIWAPAILPTLIIGLWTKRPPPLAGTLSMSVGTVVAITLWIILRLIFKYVYPSNIEIPPLVIIPAIGAALLAYALGHWIERHKTGA
jgi:SSS family solute:Na+ symporter